MGDLAQIQTRDSSNQSEILKLVRGALVRFAALYNFVLSEAIAPIWFDVLKEIPPTQLRAAFAQIEKTFIPTSACPFPTPAHVRQHIAPGETAAEKIEAEEAWQTLMKRIAHYTPDIPQSRPALPERTMRAMNASGGLEYLYSASLGELVWAKKRFLEAYQNLATVERADFLQLREASPDLARAITAVAEGKQLEQ